MNVASRTTLRTLLSSSLIAGSTLLAGCAGSSMEYAAQGEPLSPEVELEIEMARVSTSDGQWPLTVQVEELPWPSELDARSYAVWAEEPGADAPRFLGVLRYDQDARFGELDATTPHAQLTVFVTAEQSDAPSSPSDRVVVRRAIVHDPS